MRVRVRLAPVLAPLADGQRTHEFEVEGGATVRTVLDDIRSRHPAVARRVQDEQGEIRRHVNVFVASANIADLAGADTTLTDGDEVTILPAISGGARESPESVHRDPAQRFPGQASPAHRPRQVRSRS